MSKHWVKIIHIAKAKTGLDDEAYRALLWGAAGVDSASQIRTSQQYNAVMAGFANLGFQVQKRR